MNHSSARALSTKYSICVKMTETRSCFLKVLAIAKNVLFTLRLSLCTVKSNCESLSGFKSVKYPQYIYEKGSRNIRGQ